MKIQILGKKGDGKTTLAERISKEYSLPLLHLDLLKSDGRLDPLYKLLKGESWIIEGIWRDRPELISQIAESSEVLIWLDLDLETNYNNRLDRIIKEHGGNPRHRSLWDSRCREALSAYRYDGAFHREIWENHKGPKKKCESQWEWSDIKNFLNDECRSK